MSQLNVDVITGRDGQAAPEFTKGLVVTGVATATILNQNMTGDFEVGRNLKATGITTSTGGFVGNLTGTATGLSGTPNITAGSVTGTTGTFSGNVSVGGTLTYEDVTNIDSVGLVTAREGVFIPDSKELKIGNTAASPDLKLYHDGSNSYIMDSGTGGLRLCADEFNVKNAANNEVIIRGTQDAGVELNFNAATKIVTTNTGAIVTGVCTATSYSGRHAEVPKNAKSGAYTLLKTDSGQCISTNSAVTVPNAVFASGDAITVFNDSSSAIALTQGSGLQLRKAGTTTTGNLSIKQFGIVTIWFNTGGTAIASGNLA